MDEQALLHAICENPDDDAPRLVYADWLEEHGRAERAEFIRVQIELAKPASNGKHRGIAQRRANELLTQHGAQWTSELPPLPGVCWGPYERGFVTWLSLRRGQGKAVASSSKILFRSAPIQGLKADERLTTEDMRALADCASFRRLTHIDVSHQTRGLYLTLMLATSPNFSTLRSLAIWDSGIGDPGAEAIASSNSLRNLQSLSISFNQIGPDGAKALARSPNLESLLSLVLSNNRLGAEGGRSLVGSRYLKRLESLFLNANRLDDATKRLLRGRFGARVCRF